MSRWQHCLLSKPNNCLRDSQRDSLKKKRSVSLKSNNRLQTQTALAKIAELRDRLVKYIFIKMIFFK